MCFTLLHFAVSLCFQFSKFLTQGNLYQFALCWFHLIYFIYNMVAKGEHGFTITCVLLPFYWFLLKKFCG